MAGKIKPKSKPYNPARDPVPAANIIPQVHDRRAQDLNRGVVGHVEVIELDDPMGLDAGAKVVVLRNLRDDTLGGMHARKTIDEAQYQAGRDYQKYFERASSPIRAVDYERVIVDGGLSPEDLTAGQVDAVKKLTMAHDALDKVEARVVQEVIVHGLSIKDVAHARNQATDSAYRFFGKLFRQCLETLAVVYGHSSKRVLLSET